MESKMSQLTVNQQKYKNDLETTYNKFIKILENIHSFHIYFSEKNRIKSHDAFMKFLLPIKSSSESISSFVQNVMTVSKEVMSEYTIDTNMMIIQNESLYKQSKPINGSIDWLNHKEVYDFFSILMLPWISYLIGIVRRFRSKDKHMFEDFETIEIRATMENYMGNLSLRLEKIAELILSFKVILTDLKMKSEIYTTKSKTIKYNEFAHISMIIVDFMDFYNDSLLDVKFNIENEAIVYANIKEASLYIQLSMSAMVITKTVGNHMNALSMLSDWKLESKVMLKDLMKDRSGLFFHLDMVNLINEVEISLLNVTTTNTMNTMKRRIEKFKNKLLNHVDKVDLIDLLTNTFIQPQIDGKASLMIRYQIIICQVLIFKFIDFIVNIYIQMLEKLIISDSSPTRPGQKNKSFIEKYNESDNKLDINEIKNFIVSLVNVKESISIQSILRNIHSADIYNYTRNVAKILIDSADLVSELVKYSSFKETYIIKLEKTPNKLKTPRKFESPPEKSKNKPSVIIDTPLKSEKEKKQIVKIPVKSENDILKNSKTSMSFSMSFSDDM
jgi:hypothetical protein